MKKAIIILYIGVVVVMAAATMVEKIWGTQYASDNIYGAWWFSALWALLTATAIVYFIRRKVRRPSVVALHLSFVVILAGALLTHLTSKQGVVALREGVPTNQYLTQDLQQHPLPFTITLQQFEIKYHEGTNAPSDFISHIVVHDTSAPASKGKGDATQQTDTSSFTISMNKIARHKGIRLYQSNYDEDLHGSILAINSDPWGIPVTYCGYALLFVSLVWVLFDPRGTYRRLLRGEWSTQGALKNGKRLIVVCMLSPLTAFLSPLHAEPRALPETTAERFGRLFVVYNERVCPMQTYAIDFTKKLYGKRHYEDFTAEQVLTGFIFFYDDWIKEPLKQNKKPMKMEEKQTLIEQLHQGTPLKIFPYSEHNAITWYSPTATLPETMNEEHQKYIRDVFSLLNGEIQAGHYDTANEYLDKMLEYQQAFGQRSLPSDLQVKAERLYNRGPLTAMLLGIPLRWIITGHFPMTNGYETMLVLAWLVLLLSLFLFRRSRLLGVLGILLAAIFLLVSHMSQMDPQMTHLMPVLNSPLLTLHVSVIMMAYALLSFTFLCSVIALTSKCFSSVGRHLERLTRLSLLMLFPALAFLAVGIFVGAIWANVSWGTYWSWDPKETWALITLMIYAVPVHRSFSPLASTHSPLRYHAYMAMAFLTILMTYFGVNYFLGGLHGYA